MTTKSIVVEQRIAASPAVVWQSLTTPDGVASWWAPGDIAPVVGHKFLLEMPGWGNVDCEVLEAETDRAFTYTFADWVLRWTLLADEGGTHLTLDHGGFDLSNPQHRFAFDNMGPGWRDEVLPRLAAAAAEAA